MKKILALVLATIMLLSFTAFAERNDDNMTNVVSEAKNFKLTDAPVGFSGATEGTQRTDVWLQVDASGQIDVTVPLVAIFKTNIDGGKDTIEETYRIVNNSSANIAVTKVVIEDQKTDVSTNGNTSNMTMVEALTGGTTYDQYVLQFQPEDQYKDATRWAAAQNVASTADGDNKFVVNGKTYTLDSGSKKGTETKGLWLIEKKDATDGSGKDESYIKMILDTSKLSFVTRNSDTKLKDSETATDVGYIQNGVKLFTVTYTVKIDDSEAKGVDITMADQQSTTYDGYTDEVGETVTNTYKYLSSGSFEIKQ